MHRSGTSATARLLQRAGLDIGSRLMAPRLDNPIGYYEDLEFADLNRALIAAGVDHDPRYEPDWAFADRIVPSRLAPLRPRAAALVAEQGARRRAWGFKDPRTAVLLDFYDDLVPDAHYLFVYRAPWEVVDSLMRAQDRRFQGRAGLAVEAWMLYNERLLEFCERHPRRTVLVHVDAVAHRPDAVVELAQAHLDALAPAMLDAGATRDAFVDDLLRRTDVRSPLAELLAADHPDAMILYERLEAAADVASLQPSRNGNYPAIEVEAARGILPLSAVLVGAETDGVQHAELIARPAAAAAPAEAADAGIDQLKGSDLVAVVFDGRLRPDALAGAVAALQDDPALGAVLLVADDTPGPPREHDLLDGADAGAAIVLRRGAWLAVGGFAAAHPPAGFDAWSLAVGCVARDIRIARFAGALDRSRDARDTRDARRRVLEQHPALAAWRAMDAEAERDWSIQQLELAARRALDAEAGRDRATGQLEQLRATRSWHLVTRWWQLKERLRNRARSG